MQHSAESHNISNELLLELFMQQLPSNIQSVLASIQPLMLQRILEVSPIQENSTVIPSVISRDTSSYSELLKEIKSLRKEVPVLRRSRSSARHRPRKPFLHNSSPNYTICWYHRTCKSKANNCLQLCSYIKKKINGQEQQSIRNAEIISPPFYTC